MTHRLSWLRGRRLLVALFVGGLLLAACGDDGTVAAGDAGSDEAPANDEPDQIEGAPPALRRVDLGTGETIWSAPGSEALEAAVLLTDGDGVVVGIDDRCRRSQAAGFAADDGRFLWSADTPWEVEVGPADRLGVSGGVVVLPGVAPGGTPGLVAIDTTDGSEAWALEVPGLAAVDASGATIVALARTDDGVRLATVDRGTGSPGWEVAIDTDEASSAVVSGDVVAVGVRDGDGGEVVAHQLDDGRELWRAALVAGSDRATLEPAGEVVVGVDEVTGETVAVDAATGRERWRSAATLPQRGEADIGLQLVGDGHLHLQTDRGVQAVDVSSGEVVWERTADELGVDFTPHVLGVGPGRVAVAPGIELSPVDGSELARLPEGAAEALIADNENASLVVGVTGTYLISGCPGAS
jgi:outer membrane protein assembly factor BamB